MSLLRYLKKDSVLPSPGEPLSRNMPPSSLAAANKEVKRVLDAHGNGPLLAGRGKYSVYNEEEKFKVERKWE